MEKATYTKTFRAGFFTTVTQAGEAVRRLLNAGFTRDQLAVIVPDRVADQFTPDVPRAERPGSNAVEAITAGGVVGATLGGIALAATAIATGGVGLIPAASVLLGGGAVAGSFSGLIVADGYGKGVGEYYEQAIQLGKIVVGVEIPEEDGIPRLDEAAQILRECGADFITPKQE